MKPLNYNYYSYVFFENKIDFFWHFVEKLVSYKINRMETFQINIPYIFICYMYILISCRVRITRLCFCTLHDTFLLSDWTCTVSFENAVFLLS